MKPAKKASGEMRQSQLVTTFGPGSMVDLPNYSVLISGLEFWSPGGQTIFEPRLARKLARVLDIETVELRTPPPSDDSPGAATTGITGFQFPEWFITQGLEESKGPSVRTRLLVHRKSLTKGKYIDRDKKKKTVVPVRFVRACRAGHIADIDWYAFVHNGPSDCAKQGRQLFIDERGTSGDLTEVWIRCECGRAERSMAQAGVSDEEAFAEIQGRRLGSPKTDKPVKVAELETLLASKEEVGEDRPEGIFHARALPRQVWDRPWMQPIERVILVHRLREVVAQLGFTRFEAAAPDIEGELDIGVRRASLAREVTWLPAFENRGEGIFLQFSVQAIAGWLQSAEVQSRSMKLAAGFAEWKKEHVGSNREFPGPAYLMLHSFSHLLITALSLSCGYPASSIRERVYAIPRIGFGILLYTGTSDSEGTLGGLVQVGRRIHETVKSALEIGALCSNDPVCAQHDPGSRHERRFLHGAACHGCAPRLCAIPMKRCRIFGHRGSDVILYACKRQRHSSAFRYTRQRRPEASDIPSRIA